MFSVAMIYVGVKCFLAKDRSSSSFKSALVASLLSRKIGTHFQDSISANIAAFKRYKS
jgi:hypothetical protein